MNVYIHIFETSWWFHPIRKICSSNWIISPRDRGENSQNLWVAKYLPRVPNYTVETEYILWSTFSNKGFGHPKNPVIYLQNCRFWGGPWLKRPPGPMVEMSKSKPRSSCNWIVPFLGDQWCGGKKCQKKWVVKWILGPKTQNKTLFVFFLAAT